MIETTMDDFGMMDGGGWWLDTDNPSYHSYHSTWMRTFGDSDTWDEQNSYRPSKSQGKITMTSNFSYPALLRGINIVLGMLGGLALVFPPFVFIFNATRWRPRDWWIGYMIVMGIDFLIYLVYFGLVMRGGADVVTRMFGPRAGNGTYKRFIDYWWIKFFNFATLATVCGFWLSTNKNKLHKSDPEPVSYLNGNVTPFAPGKDDAGFFEFQSLCTIHVFFFIVDLVYNIVFTADLFDSREQIYSDEQSEERDREDNSKRRGQKEQVDITRDSFRSWAEVNVMRLNLYYASNALLYLSAFIVFLISLPMSFDIKTPMYLYVMLGFVILMTLSLIFVFASYYWGASSLRATFTLISSRGDMNIHYTQLRAHLFWLFITVFNWYCFSFYWAQQGADKVDFNKVPHFHRHPSSPRLIQTNAWYVWQVQVLFNLASIPLAVRHLVGLVFMSAKAPIYARVTDAKKLESESEESSPAIIMISIVAFFWIVLLTLYGFTWSALLGKTFLGIHYEQIVITFTVVALVLIVVLIIMNRNRLGVIDDSPINNYLNASWTLSSWCIAFVLPVYYIISITIYWFSFSKYQGSLTSNAIKVLIQQPTVAPVNSITYYWWNINVSQILLLVSLVLILIDVHNTITIKRHVKSKKKGSSRSKSSDSESIKPKYESDESS